ncbi:MAG: hypothetical protein ACRDGI_05475 [Candidatus Limnocylindrales bacterium]
MARSGGRWTPTRLRPGADRRLLLVVASFGVSVVITRAFLGATGYPQIAGGEFHVAHVLIGGALLFAGSVIALISIDDRAIDGAALLVGAGVGLFIDEVGKFITSNNDYFFPIAAPIIYAVFMVSVVLLLAVRERFGESLVPVPVAPSRWKHLRGLLVLGYAGSAVVALVEAGGVMGLVASIHTPFDLLISQAAANQLSGSNPLWLDVHAAASVVAGFLFLAATILLWLGRDARGLRFGLSASVISLTVLALVAFYVNQFAAIGGVAVQALLVVGAMEHRRSTGTGDPPEEWAAPSF